MVTSPNASARAASEAPGLLAAVGVLLRGRWLLFFGLLGGLVVAGLYSFTRRPTYRATSKIMLEDEGPSSLFGDLASLASMGSAPTAASELEILTSRPLLGFVVAAPAGVDLPRPGLPGADKQLGLTTLVHDERVTPWKLLRRAFLNEGKPGQAPVLPDGRLFAQSTLVAEPGAEDDDAPRIVRVEVLARDRVALSSVSLRVTLGLEDARREEHAWPPGEPILYRGIQLHMEFEGEVIGGSFLVERLPEWRAIQGLHERTSARETARGSGIVAVSVIDTDAWRAAETANALSETYVEGLAERSRQRAGGTIDYVRGLLDEEEARFREALATVGDIYADHPEALGLETAAQTLLTRLVELEEGTVRLELARGSLEDVVSALERGDYAAFGRLDAAVTGGLILDPLTQGLFASIAQLDAESASLRARYLEGVASREQVEAARAELVENVHTQLRSRLDGVRVELQRAVEERDLLLEKFAGLPETQKRLAEPLLVLRAHEEILPALVKSLQTAEIAANAASLSAQIIEPAVAASEIHTPKSAFHLVAGATVGLTLAVLAVLLLEPRRGRVLDGAELERVSGLPLLAAVPLSPRSALPPRETASSRATAGYRALASQLFPPEPLGLVVGVTSTQRGEGRATIALGMARTLARTGRAVLLVDLDLEAPHLHTLLGDVAAPGVAELLRGELHLPADEAALLRKAEPEGLRVLLAGAPGTLDGDRLLSASWRERLLQWRSQGLAVVLLLAPAGDAATAGLAPQLDKLLLVHARGRAPRRRLLALLDTLAARGVTPTGLCWNRAARRDPRAG